MAASKNSQHLKWQGVPDAPHEDRGESYYVETLAKC
jgi:hypothetical protein